MTTMNISIVLIDIMIGVTLKILPSVFKTKKEERDKEEEIMIEAWEKESEKRWARRRGKERQREQWGRKH